MKRSCRTTPACGSGSAAAINPPISFSSVLSKLPSTALRNALDRTKPPTASASIAQIAAAAIRRAASELKPSELNRKMLGAKGRIFQAVAQAAYGLDQIGVQLFAQPADEHFDGVGVTVEILVVKMLDQFGARDDLATLIGEIGQEPVFQAGELDGIAVQGDATGAGVDVQGADIDVGGGEAGGAAQERTQPCQQFLGIERLGEVIIGPGIEARHLVAPAVARGEDQDRHG